MSVNTTFSLNCAGSPFQFVVIDSSKVTIRGDGLGLVRANHPANFLLTAPPAQLKDIDICITGKSANEWVAITYL